MSPAVGEEVERVRRQGEKDKSGRPLETLENITTSADTTPSDVFATHHPRLGNEYVDPAAQPG